MLDNYLNDVEKVANQAGDQVVCNGGSMMEFLNQLLADSGKNVQERFQVLSNKQMIQEPITWVEQMS